VSIVLDQLRGRLLAVGGIVGYPLDRLHEEVAYIAYHLHWPLEEILALEHADRRRWAEEVAAINRRLNEEAERTSY
jgi:hypothetical protein